MGPYVSSRHASLNGVTAQAGRDAGFAVFMEQVVPELGFQVRRRRGRHVSVEAVLDLEFFGRLVVPDRLLDGTVRHPVARHVLDSASTVPGAAAEEGALCKE